MRETTRVAAAAVLAIIVLMPSVATATVAKRTAVVVPTQLNGFFPHREDWQHELDLWLGDRLRMVQFSVAGEEMLSPGEARCFDADCLAAVAKAHSLDVVVAARVINDQQDLTTFHLMVRMLFKGASGETPAMRERQAKCPNCSLSAVREQLVVLEGAALANTPPAEPMDRQPAPPIKSAPPLSVMPSIEYGDRFSRQQRLVFKSVGVTVGAVGLLAIVQGFVELHHQGDIVVQNGMRYERETGTAQAALFTVGAVLAVGGGALAVLGWTPLKRSKHHLTIAPSGAGAQLRGAF